MKKKKLSNLLLSAVLSASLLVESFLPAMAASADEIPFTEVVQEQTESVSVLPEDITSVVADDLEISEVSSEEAVVVSTETEETIPTESEEPGEETSTEEATVPEEVIPTEDSEIIPDGTAVEVETTEEPVVDSELPIQDADAITVDEEIIPIVVEEQPGTDLMDENPLFSDAAFLQFEQNYTLSEEQLAEKEDAPNMIKDFEKSSEGVNYVADEVYFFAQTEEEALQVAEAFHGELAFFDSGVAVITLQDYSVSEAVYASFNSQTNVPVVYPNYIRYWDSMVPEDETFVVEQEPIVAEDDCDNVIVSDEMVGAEEITVSDDAVSEIVEAADDELTEEIILLDNNQAVVTEEITEDISEDEMVDYETMEVEDFELGDLSSIDTTAFDAYNDEYLKVNNTLFQWHHVILGSAEAWNVGYTGSGIKVGVLDSGVVNHTDLKLSGVYVPSGSSYASGSYGDSVGHGTMVCGTIASKKNNSVGGVGVAPDVALYSYKIDDKGSPLDAYAIAALKRAVMDGIDVVNISSGGYQYSAGYAAAVKEAYEAGIVIVAAAGNENTTSLHYPSSLPHVISVAATDRSNLRTSFSTYGSSVDLSAPGVDITTTTSNGSYSAVNGTSFSSPIVAAEAALVLQAAGDGSIPASKVTFTKGSKRVNTLEKYMKSCAKSVGSGMGKGIVFLPKALKISYAAKKPSTPSITVPVVGNNQAVNVTIKAEKGSRLFYSINGKKPSFPANANTIGVNSNTTSFTLSTAGLTKAPTYTIYAMAVNSAGTKSSIKKVSIRFKPNVTGISLTGITSLARGKSTVIKASVYPSFASNKKLTWEVISMPSGATKSSFKVSGGKVTASSSAPLGTYVIKATAADKSGAYQSFGIKVIEKTYISTARFSKSSITVVRDGSNLTYNLLSDASPAYLSGKRADGVACPANDFLWTSSKPAVAAVNASGQLTVYGPGTTTITALANDGSGKKATLKVKVLQLVAGFNVTSSSSFEIGAGNSATFKAVVYPYNASSKKVSWDFASANSPSAPSASGDLAKLGLKVSSAGKVTTTARTPAGVYYLRVKSKDQAKRAAVYPLKIVSGKITGIKYSVNGTAANSASIFRVAGNYNAPTSTVVSAAISGSGSFSAKNVKLTCSNPSLVQIGSLSFSGNTANFKVTASGAAKGSAKITLAATDGSNKKATFTVNVKNPASSLVLGFPTNNVAQKYSNSPAYIALAGKTIKIKTTFGQEFGSVSGKKLSWSVSDPSTATISSTGQLKIKKVKYNTVVRVTATATDGSNVTASTQVLVNATPIRSITCDFMITVVHRYWFGSYTTQERFRKGVKVDASLSSKGFAFPMKVTGSCFGFQVTSSNPKVCAAYYDSSIGGIRLIYRKKGTSKITIRGLDGGNGKSTYFTLRLK